MPAPSHQMPAGAQVAFAMKWLESQNIESQTIDVLAHIDPSLSYEENIKSMKRQLGLGGGRSRQPAVRGLTAAECDVAIGNFEAGFNHEVTRDACKCGHPEACEKIEQDRREKTGPVRSEVAWQAAQAEQRAARKTTKKPAARKPEPTSANVEKFRQLLIKYPDRRVQTIKRMRGLLASHILGRDFGESMEAYYARQPDIRRTDEGLKALIAEAERGAVKPAPAPNLPPALTAPPELTADILGTGPMGLTPAPATKPKRKPKKTAAKPAKKPKTTKKPAKPKAKTPAAAQKLTAAQREHLAIQGFVMVRRGGKYVKITR